MRPELKRKKQEDRNKERWQRRARMALGSILAVAALAFAMASFTRSGSSSKEVASAASEGFRRISVDEMKTLFDRGELTIIDVRQADAYLEAHIPGALQIPLSRIDGEASYLSKQKMIVTYCTCPGEESSGQAVQILAHRGITNAAALQGGLEAWQRRGYPVSAGAPTGS